MLASVGAELDAFGTVDSNSVSVPFASDVAELDLIEVADVDTVAASLLLEIDKVVIASDVATVVTPFIVSESVLLFPVVNFSLVASVMSILVATVAPEVNSVLI